MNAEIDWGKSDLEVHLKLKGGWGMENLTSACGWIAKRYCGRQGSLRVQVPTTAG